MFKKIFSSVRQYKKKAFLVILLVLIEALCGTLVPFVMGKLIDLGIIKGNLFKIESIGIILLIITLIAMASGVSASWLAGRTSAGFAANLRYDLFSHIQTFSFENIDSFSTSSLITRLTTDVNNMQLMYAQLIRIAVRAPLLLIFSAVMAIIVSVKLSLIFIIMLPILGVFLTLIINKAKPLFKRVFRNYDHLNQVLRENIRGIKVVKAYSQAEQETNKFDDAAHGIYKVFTKAQQIMALNAPLMQLTTNLTMLLLCLFGAVMIVHHQLQAGQLVSMFSYTMTILMSLNMLSMVFTQLSMATASGERISRVLDTQSTILNKKNAVKNLHYNELTFEDVNFSFNHTDNQLQDLNFTIRKGQTFGIIGTTGSGKSTLVELIPRLYDVTSGKITIDQTNIKDVDIKALRHNIAMVLQNNVLFAGTIKDNLRWGNAQATDLEIKQACQLAQAEEFIDQLPNKYDFVLEENGSNLSGGQKQRLCLARALLKHPQILILDDATSAVDTETDYKIRLGLNKYLPNAMKFIISQRISSIAAADQIIVLDQGRIVGLDTHQNLLKNNKIYRDIYESQKYGDKS